MRIIIIIFLLTSRTLFAGDGIREAVTNAEKELQEVKKSNSDLSENIISERKSLDNKIDLLRQEIKKLKKQQKKIETDRIRMEDIFNDLNKTVSERKFESVNFSGNFKEAVKLFRSFLKNCAIGIQFSGYIGKCSSLLAEEIVTEKNLQEFIKMVDIILNETGKISKFKSEYINSEGNIVEGNIIRFGNVSCVYNEESGKSGMLYYSAGDKKLFSSSVHLTGFQKKEVTNYFNKSAEKEIRTVPIDITGGAVLISGAREESFFNKIKSGGIVMLPIIAVGIAALIIIIERVFSLRKIKKETESLMNKVIKQINNSCYEGAEKLCIENPCAVSNIMLAGIKFRNNSREVIEDHVRAAILNEVPLFEKFLSVLNVLGSIAPLLGLLGTVMGMITTFNMITLWGVGEPKIMSGGISEALITTEFGLIVAIPIILFHNYISGKVDGIINRITEKSNILVETLTEVEN